LTFKQFNTHYKNTLSLIEWEQFANKNGFGFEISLIYFWVQNSTENDAESKLIFNKFIYSMIYIILNCIKAGDRRFKFSSFFLCGFGCLGFDSIWNPYYVRNWKL